MKGIVALKTCFFTVKLSDKLLNGMKVSMPVYIKNN